MTGRVYPVVSAEISAFACSRALRASPAAFRAGLSSRIACWTRPRVASETYPSALMTRETVWCETPASAATSLMVGRLSVRGWARFTGTNYGGNRRIE